MSCSIFWASVQFDGYMIIVLYKYDTFRGGRVLQNVHNEQVHADTITMVALVSSSQASTLYIMWFIISLLQPVIAQILQN